MAGDVTRLYRVKYVIEDSSAPALQAIRNSFVAINLETDTAVQSAALFGRALSSLKQHVGTLNQVDLAMRRLDTSSALLSGHIGGLGLEVGKAAESLRTFRNFQKVVKDGLADLNDEVMKTAAGVRTFKQFRESIVGAQRAAYGLKKNLEEGNAALAALVLSGHELAAAKANIGGIGTAATAATEPTKGLAAGMAGFVAKVAGLSVASEAAHNFGEAMKEARDFAAESAGEVIRIRDGLRELANLQGHGGVSDQTVLNAVALRQASGLDEKGAKEFQEQFEGSFPLATDKHNITDTTGKALAAEVARSAVRVGLDPRTAGDLAGSIGSFGKIETAGQGIGQVQQVIDQLNDGRGNLTPLVKELLKGGAATIGPGQAFRSAAERSAALSVTTGIVGAPGQTSTALGAAIRSLNGFTKAQGPTLAKYGIESGQDLVTQIERIAPLITEAQAAGKNPAASLAEAGFGNKLDRDAIVGLVANRQLLRDRTDAVRETDGSVATKAGERAIGLNNEFFRTDKAAANRVAEANLTAGRTVRGLENEPLAIARKNAEAQLIAEKRLDTVASNFDIKMRNLLQLSAISGADARLDLIDSRVRSNLRAGAEAVGIRILRKRIEYGQGQEAQQELAQYGPQVLGRQGNPYGAAVNLGAAASVDVGKKLDRIAEAIERQPAAPGQVPRDLPTQRPVFSERR